MNVYEYQSIGIRFPTQPATQARTNTDKLTSLVGPTGNRAGGDLLIQRTQYKSLGHRGRL